MIGAIAGDIIGSIYEHLPMKRKTFPLFGNGCGFTDDTVLTLAVAKCILDNEAYAEVFREICWEYPYAGYGGNFSNWLKYDGAGPYNSYGNGSGMRVSPVAWAFENEDEVLGEAKRSAEVTHNHPEGIKGAQAIALAIFLARTGNDMAVIKQRIAELFEYDLDRTLDEIRPGYYFDVTCQGSVPEAIICFLESSSFEDAIRNAISLGGDSDTLACMAGSIAEAYYGVPDDIREKAESYLPNDLLEIYRDFRNRFILKTSESTIEKAPILARAEVLEPVYAKELEVALQAANSAGEILREGFNREGGPVGSYHHAEADDQAEGAIKKILREAFPEDGYLGEELGSDNLSGASRIWVIDPNDGTSAYMSGYRGSAVSIALLEHDRPVLGVVYAFNYPDDNGDLICWAKGGPVIRNAEPVNRIWDSEPNCSNTVLVSHVADLNSEGNAECCSPMRYRTMPSIAYRLALAAVGDGDAAVSLQNVASWDVVAGHAILIGAKADVYDKYGNPYTYSKGRLESGDYTFGGPKPYVDFLIRKPWYTVFRRPNRDTTYTLCKPYHNGEVDSGMLSRAQGCLLGQFAGDSLGSLVEFQNSLRIKESYPDGLYHLADGGTFNTIAGQPTDDSEMALLLARTLIEAKDYDPYEAFEAYKYWLESGPFDCGFTISAGLTGAPNTGSQANGAMMRVSPLGIFGANRSLSQVAKWASDDAAITHPNPVCVQANSLFATAIAQAIKTGREPSFIYEQLVFRAKEMAVDTNLMQTILDASEEPPSNFINSQGWVLIAFQNALYQLLHAPNLEEAIVDTVMRGGDTDTNGAICGALLGAVYGRQAVPLRWQKDILRCRPIAGQPNVYQPRPECFWPVDVLNLAERLLMLKP